MPQMSFERAMEVADKLRLDGKLAEAESICRQVLAATPDSPFALNRLGICLGDADRLGEARDSFQRAIKVSPGYLDAWSNLSLAFERMEDWDSAIAARRQVIALNPNSAEYWHRLGACLGKKSDYAGAIEALNKSLSLDGDNDGTHHDLLMSLCGKRDLEAAETVLFGRILAVGKVRADSVRVLADTLKHDGRFEDATNVWQRALDLDPACSEARGQLAMCRITLGDYERGWELYESRWECDSFSGNCQRDPARQWGREPLGHPDVSGKTILLYSEQGIGDTIQFVRYASLFAQRGARVIVDVPWPVKLLLQKCNGVRLAYGLNEVLPTYDWHVPMLSLPNAFGTTLKTIPAEVPYLKVDASRQKSWAGRVERAAKAGTKLRVGLAWAGNPKHKNDANRSIHPSLFAPLADAGKIAFFGLQKSNENEKAAIMPERPRLIDFAASLCDFAETAGLIEHLDLVICADTAIAHLAGALGKPVWTLCPFVPDFRWGLSGETSPWYPTMRVFRQNKPGDWASVIGAVAKALGQRASG